MCNVGGPRCEYSQLWLARKRKLARTPAYREGGEYARERLEKAERWKFQRDHASAYQAQLPARAKWQTKAAPLPRRQAEAFRKTFPAMPAMGSEEAKAHTQKLAEEHEKLVEDIYSEEASTLGFYAMEGHETINSYLRLGVKGLPPDDDLPEDLETLTKEHIEVMDSVFARAEKSVNPRQLFRHMLVEPGITPRAFAEKYFKVGERVTDAAYMSTTEDPAYIRGHVFKRHPSEYLVMRILSRQGISMQRDEEEIEGDLQSWEKERLLPRGTKLRVVGIRNDEYSIAEEREGLRKQFGRHRGPSKIPPKRLVTVYLIDEEEL